MTEPEKQTFLRYSGLPCSKAPSETGTVSAETLQPTDVIFFSFIKSKSLAGEEKHIFGIITVDEPHKSGI